MDNKAKMLLRDFIQEKLDGELKNFRSFDIKSLRDSEKYGCPGRYFDCDDTEIMRAVYVVLWENFLPDLSMDTLGNAGKYRGDTMNSFHTMFGREIPERPGFYAGLEKYDPSDEIRERVREFSRKYCSTIGNFVVLPNLCVRNTTLNCYRGTNQWRDFFDRFLIELNKILLGQTEGIDRMLKELVDANGFCFNKFRGEKAAGDFIEDLVLTDYCDLGNQRRPRIVFPMNYHWMNECAADRYFDDVNKYLDEAENIINHRAGKLILRLQDTLSLSGTR